CCQGPDYRRLPAREAMEGHGEKLSRTQEKAIAALLSEATLGKAAKKAQVTEKTLRSWLRLPEFHDAYALARGDVLEHAVAKTQKASGAAVETLVQKLKSKTDAVAVRAATELLGITLKATEVLDYKRRLGAIEAGLKDGDY